MLFISYSPCFEHFFCSFIFSRWFLLKLQTKMLSLITVSSQKWCKLRGNLLFYFKSNDQFSEPAGVIVLEKYRVTVSNEPSDSYEGYPFLIGKEMANIS